MTPLNTRHDRKPTGYKVAPQSYATLEQAAKDLWPFLPKVPGDKYKICGWRLLEQTLARAEFSLRVAPRDTMAGCAAFTVPDDKLIVIDEPVYEGLHNGSVFSLSTVVHETCHIVLRHHVTLHRGAPVGQHRHFEDSEWQAKAMTAAVMMPEELCSTVADPRLLAVQCQVSVEAATYRLDRLGKLPKK